MLYQLYSMQESEELTAEILTPSLP